jgi:hypothetical protein
MMVHLLGSLNTPSINTPMNSPLSLLLKNHLDPVGALRAFSIQIRNIQDVAKKKEYHLICRDLYFLDRDRNASLNFARGSDYSRLEYQYGRYVKLGKLFSIACQNGFTPEDDIAIKTQLEEFIGYDSNRMEFSNKNEEKEKRCLRFKWGNIITKLAEDVHEPNHLNDYKGRIERERNIVLDIYNETLNPTPNTVGHREKIRATPKSLLEIISKRVS